MHFNQSVGLGESIKREIGYYYANGLAITTITYIFISNPLYYGGSQCNDLYQWSSAFFYYGCWLFLLGFILLTSFFLNGFLKVHNVIEALRKFFWIISLIGGFTIIIGMCCSYAEDEPCNSLRTYVLVLIILYGAAFSLVILSFCCCFCFIWGMSFAVRPNTMIHQELENENSV